MAKLAEIVTDINDTLKATQFGSKRFQKGRWSGVAELVRTSEDETVPCVVENDGDTIKLGMDDTYPFEVYHRMIGGSFEASEDDFGANKVRRETSEMVIIMMGDRNRLELTNEQILSGLALGFPLQLTAAEVLALSLQSVEFDIQGFDRDREAIWTREFNTTKRSLKPNTLLVSLRYQVVTEVFDTCVGVCIT